MGDGSSSISSRVGTGSTISDGGNMPERLRIRPPSFINLQSIEQMSVGSMIADLVAVIGTLDIVLGEIDR